MKINASVEITDSQMMAWGYDDLDSYIVEVLTHKLANEIINSDKLTTIKSSADGATKYTAHIVILSDKDVECLLQ